MAFTSRQLAPGQQSTIVKSQQYVAGIQARHARRAAALRLNVLAAERPPGYIQRPARRSTKKQPQNAESQSIGDGPALQEAAGAEIQAAAEQQQQQQQEQQHAQQQLWKEQQLLLQEQWQKQQHHEQQQLPQQQLQQGQQRSVQRQRPQQPAQHAQQQRQQQWQQQQLPQQQQQQQRRGTPPAHGPQQPSSTLPAAAHVQESSRQLRMQPAAPQPNLNASTSVNTSRSSGSSSAYGSARSNSSSSSPPRLVAAAPAYSVVPTATAPSVTAAATRAAAKAAAVAAAAAGSANSSGGLPAVLPRAEQCVPRQFWGLMNEELRPWHKQVLVQLCFCQPPPACYVYRDMRAGTMQGVLAQRAMLEKAVRAGLVELEWQARRMLGWLDTVSRQDAPGCVAPESVQQAQQELANLKSSLGATRSQLASLQAKARTYSDADYLTYSSRFEGLLLEMQSLADLVRLQQAPLVHRVQDAREVAARRALFAPTSAAAAAAQDEAAAVVRAELARAGPMCRDAAHRLSNMRREMQHQLDWRYPPQEYVLWRFKGRPGASKPPLAMPGLKRAVPAVRQGVQQLPRVSSH